MDSYFCVCALMSMHLSLVHLCSCTPFTEPLILITGVNYFACLWYPQVPRQCPIQCQCVVIPQSCSTCVINCNFVDRSDSVSLSHMLSHSALSKRVLLRCKRLMRLSLLMSLQEFTHMRITGVCDRATGK